MTLLVASIAGAAGALCRYVVSGWMQQHTQSDFPVGTLTVNLTGSLLLGLVAGADHLQTTTALAVVGFLGGFTTFSTWMIETIRLGFPARRSTRALANLVLTLAAGVALAAASYSLTN
ncbi:MAG TPA: CrcB family protein [Acidimicrobiia bacterium]|nr:CrcB family protein [Acidimicrobiia bacterium]